MSTPKMHKKSNPLPAAERGQAQNPALRYTCANEQISFNLCSVYLDNPVVPIFWQLSQFPGFVPMP